MGIPTVRWIKGLLIAALTFAPLSALNAGWLPLASAAAGGGSPAVSYATFYTPSVTSLVATQAGASIGTASADRVVAVVVHAVGGFVSLTSVKLDTTNTMTTAVSDFQNGALVGIAYLAWPSNTTASITVTLSGALSDGSPVLIEVHSLTGLSSGTPTGTGNASSTSATALTTSNFSTTSGGVSLIGASQQGVGSSSCTITGTTGSITQNHANYALGGFSCSTTASATGLATSAASNYTATWNGAAQVSAVVAAAWR